MLMRTLACIAIGGVVGWIAETQSIATALGLLATFVLLAFTVVHSSLVDIARAMDYNFERLRHLHQRDDDQDA